jgi:hypothetical protein
MPAYLILIRKEGKKWILICHFENSLVPLALTQSEIATIHIPKTEELNALAQHDNPSSNNFQCSVIL